MTGWPGASRRELMRLAAASASAALAPAAAHAQPAPASPAVSPRAYGGLGDGRADDRAAFAALDDRARAHAPVDLRDGDWRIGSSLTLGRGVSVLGGAGRIIVPDGVTLTINGPVLAPRQQIFQLHGSGRVVLDIGQTSEGCPEWWGEGVAALEQCVRNCAVTRLAARDYLIDRTWLIDTPYRSVIGAGLSDGYERGHGTRIICTNGSVDAVQVGPASEPRGGPSHYRRNIALAGFSVQHGTGLRLPGRGREKSAPMALRLRYLLNASIRELAAWEPLVGFYCHGLVYSRLDDCRVFRSAPRGGGADFFRGFWLDGTPHVLAGGNASLYLNRCGVEMGGRPPLFEPTGFWLNGGFVDCFLNLVETSQVPTGIRIIGNGPSVTDASNIDLHIVSPVIDQCSNAAVEISGTAASAMVEFVDFYAGVPASARFGIHIHDGAGQIAFNGGQIAGNGGTTVGFHAENQSGFELRGLKILGMARPVGIISCSDFLVEPWIHNPVSVANPYQAAVFIGGSCRLGTIRPAIKGRADAFPQGVLLSGGGHSRLHFDPTRIDPACISGGAANKLQLGGAQVRARGDYSSAGRAMAGGPIHVSGVVL